MHFSLRAMRLAGNSICPTVVAVAFLAALSGCGGDLAEVSGLVTLDGQPVRGGDGVRGTVFLQPKASDGRAAVGNVDENGFYVVSSGSQSGVKPGEYLVSFTATKAIPSKIPGAAPSGKPITPRKYADARTSGLQLTVEPGDNEYNLPLTTSSQASTR